jgi:ACS family glucarate transporter-like MFS transporter
MVDFNLTQVEMGRVFSVFLLGYSLCQVPAGLLADRFGARRVLTVAVFLWVLLTVLQAVAGLWPANQTTTTILVSFMICRLLLGISESPTYTGSSEGVSRWVPADFRARANGVVIASVGLGSAVAPILISNVMVRWGWRMSLILSAVPAAIIAIVWLFVKEPPSLRKSVNVGSAEQESKSKSFLTRDFIFLTISYTLQGYVGYIFVSWFYLYLIQERHFGLLSGAWMSSLPWVLSIISIPLGGWVSDRLLIGRLGRSWGSRFVPMAGMLLSGVLISIGAHTENAIVAGVTLALATAFILSVEGPFWAAMMNLAGRRSGAAGGIMNMGSNLGGLISPALTPVLAQFIGWENALHIAAGLAVVGAVLWIWIRPAPSGLVQGPIGY